MMNIFYDFETSTSDLLGQILSYCFIVCDDEHNTIEELNGLIKVKRTELPEVGAILTNKLNVDTLEKEGDTEYEAAHKIYAFLKKWVEKKGQVTLIGFNSNAFDINFLRTALIRYGINPYFMGKIQNKDILHYAKHLAFNNKDTFPWTQTQNDEGATYYSFKLEHLAKAFQRLDIPQSHDAREDVLLTIDLVKTLEQIFSLPLNDFSPVYLGDDTLYQGNIFLAKQKVSHYPKDSDTVPLHYEYRYFLGLDHRKKSKLLLNLNTFETRSNSEQETLLSCIQYINLNKHFFVLEPLNEAEMAYYAPILQEVSQFPFFKTLNQDRYFELSKKDWDIDYQIHELGFDRIDTLGASVETIIADMDRYPDLVKTLWQNRKDPKDKYLVQLLNRVYLNYHPNPQKEHLFKYLSPRYITGTLLRDPDKKQSITDRLTQMSQILTDPNASDLDKANIQALKALTESFDILMAESNVSVT